MGSLVQSVMLDLVSDRLAGDAKLVSLLSRTCKAYRDAFPVAPGMLDLEDWLIAQERLEDSTVVSEGTHIVFKRCQIWRGKRGGQEWRLTATCGRKMAGLFFNHRGVIRVGKCSATLVILGSYRTSVQFKDSFYGIQDLETFKQCLASHTILCHEMPENLPCLPATVVHRHRDNVHWTFARAFYVWRASLPAEKRGQRELPELQIVSYSVIQIIDGQRVETWYTGT